MGISLAKGKGNLPVLLSVGFWAPYVYGHWAIACVGDATKDYWWLSYPGFQACALAIVAVVLLCFSPEKSSRRLGAGLDWASAFAMSVAAIALGFGVVDGAWQIGACAAVASLAQVWVQMRWWNEFAKADIKDVALALCIGMLVVASFKILMVFLGEAFTVLAAALPLATVAFLGVPLRSGTKREQNWFSAKVLCSLWRVGAAIAVFLVIWAFLNALLKSSTGHYGFGASAAPALTIFAQAIDIAFALVLAWWVGRKKGTVEYVQLWRFAYVCLAVSLLLLVCFGLSQAIQVFSSAAFVIASVLIDLAAANISQHSSFRPFFVFGAAELVYQVADWAGRGAVAAFGISFLDASVAVALMFVSMVMTAFFLPHRALGSRYLLSDLNGGIPHVEDHRRIDERCEAIAKEKSLSSRELEMMQYLCRGRLKPYIAEALYLSENTVGTYIRRLYQKLGVHSKQELLNLVLAEGAIS